MRNIIVVTGGAGFVGSNLIEKFLKKTNFRIISIDNYSSGKISNHFKNSRVKYINSDTIKIAKTLNSYRKRINSIYQNIEGLSENSGLKKLDKPKIKFYNTKLYTKGKDY